ncbi:hypothetical protein BD560DRAFT_404403 [Blakeslea trispora]|nr:hypothetical protein BD560DRAFT_404403 [Blakeslea trispora]
MIEEASEMRGDEIFSMVFIADRVGRVFPVRDARDSLRLRRELQVLKFFFNEVNR